VIAKVTELLHQIFCLKLTAVRMLLLAEAGPPAPYFLGENNDDLAQDNETAGVVEYTQDRTETPLDGAVPRF
jgi:hypothetical protein